MSNPVHDGTSRVAANKDTAIVISGGERFSPKNKVVCAHFDTCPLIRKSPRNTPRLAGVKFGRFEVIGLSEKNGMWVVRCACGDYEFRSARAIRNPANQFDRCHKCRHLAFLTKEHHWRTTGREIDLRELLSR